MADMFLFCNKTECFFLNLQPEFYWT